MPSDNERWSRCRELSPPVSQHSTCHAAAAAILVWFNCVVLLACVVCVCTIGHPWKKYRRSTSCEWSVGHVFSASDVSMTTCKLYRTSMGVPPRHTNVSRAVYHAQNTPKKQAGQTRQTLSFLPSKETSLRYVHDTAAVAKAVVQQIPRAANHRPRVSPSPRLALSYASFTREVTKKIGSSTILIAFFNRKYPLLFWRPCLPKGTSAPQSESRVRGQEPQRLRAPSQVSLLCDSRLP